MVTGGAQCKRVAKEGTASTASKVVVGVSAPPTGACVEGFCWLNPLPQGNDLDDVWSVSATDVWAVGEFGAIVHYDGSTWSNIAGGQGDRLLDVWASGDDDVWVASQSDGVLHGGMKGFAPASVPDADADNADVKALWGSSADDVWAVGSAIFHFDGHAWTTSMKLADDASLVCGTGAADVWVAGATAGATFVLHYDGHGWTRMPSSSDGDPYAIWCSGPNQPWIAGEYASLVRWDGAAWVNVPSPGDGWMTLGGSGPTDVWAAGDRVFHYDGHAWAEQSVGDDAFAFTDGVSGQGSEDVWLVGESGKRYHFNGKAWREVGDAMAGLPQGEALEDLWGAGGEVFAGDLDRDALFEWNGQGLTPADPAAAHAYVGARAYRVSQDGSGIEHWDGTAFTAVPWWKAPSGAPDLPAPLAVWADTADDVWVAGVGTLAHWDGHALTLVVDEPVPAGPDPPDTRDVLEAVWGTGPADVWAVGEDSDEEALAVHFTGHAFTRTVIAGVDELTAVAGAGADVWALTSDLESVGEHYDGSRWSPIDCSDPDPDDPDGDDDYSPASSPPLSVDAPGDAWTVGGSAILHLTAKGCHVVDLETDQLQAIYADPSGNVWASGDDGALVYRRAADAIQEKPIPPPDGDTSAPSTPRRHPRIK
jgi:hypothetical protein